MLAYVEHNSPEAKSKKCTGNAHETIKVDLIPVMEKPIER
jgi:hypothetical protein